MIDRKLYNEATKLIEQSQKILITTHRKPDGDACGSVAALARALRARKKHVSLLALTDVPQWYEFVFEQRPALFGQDMELSDIRQGDYDLIIIADTNSYSQLPGIEEYISEAGVPVLVFDHHVTNDSLGDVELIDTNAAATAMIVLDFLNHNRWKVTHEIACALFVGIATDTGWFHFTNTGADVHRAVAWLIEQGVKPPEVHKKLFQNYSMQRFRLMVAMLETLELHFDGRFAVQHLLKSDFSHTGGRYEDTEDFIDQCQKIRSVEAAALFVELPDGAFKCSLRSSGIFNARQVAQKLGGGGHEMAAGVRLEGPLEAAKEKIFFEVGEQLKASGCIIEGREQEDQKKDSNPEKKS